MGLLNGPGGTAAKARQGVIELDDSERNSDWVKTPKNKEEEAAIMAELLAEYLAEQEQAQEAD